MVEILDPKEGESIYNPACGTGGDPRTFFGKVYGQEKNLTTSSVARMNLVLHGIEDFQIAREDTLRDPAGRSRGWRSGAPSTLCAPAPGPPGTPPCAADGRDRARSAWRVHVGCHRGRRCLGVRSRALDRRVSADLLWHAHGAPQACRGAATTSPARLGRARRWRCRPTSGSRAAAHRPPARSSGSPGRARVGCNRPGSPGRTPTW